MYGIGVRQSRTLQYNFALWCYSWLSAYFSPKQIRQIRSFRNNEPSNYHDLLSCLPRLQSVKSSSSNYAAHWAMNKSAKFGRASLLEMRQGIHIHHAVFFHVAHHKAVMVETHSSKLQVYRDRKPFPANVSWGKLSFESSSVGGQNMAALCVYVYHQPMPLASKVIWLGGEK